MESNGTTGKAQATRWSPPRWWFDRQTSRFHFEPSPSAQIEQEGGKKTAIKTEQLKILKEAKALKWIIFLYAFEKTYFVFVYRVYSMCTDFNQLGIFFATK